VADNDPRLDGLKPSDYHLAPGERLNEAITRSWTRLLAAWHGFDDARGQLPQSDAGGRLTRERWLLILFGELDYGRLRQHSAIEIEDKSFPVFSQWENTPIHLLGCRVNIDARTPGVAGAATQSPHSLMQELLNRSPERLWGFISNGLVLRVLRDNVALTRQAYLEFDLETMFSGEIYSDFVLLWLVCHQSRVEGERPEDCWLEKWTKVAAEQGTRALEALRDGVQEAIEILGRGFLAHPSNQRLHEALREGSLEPARYYRHLLRLVYRLLFLFVAEDRDALLAPDADARALERYSTHYSTRRLRQLAQRRRGGRQHDCYEQLKLVMAFLDSEGCVSLGLPALGSFLWSSDAIEDLTDATVDNESFLNAVRALATVNEGGVLRAVDFRNLGAEELGSVYESLLELDPHLDPDTATFALEVSPGSERKTTGSYYTPSSLISALLDSALEPVLDEAARAADPEAAILNLAVVDPASGSGHFLIAAANRIAKRLAAIRTGDPEPSPEAVRAAVRDVVGRCIYAVDVNPMAVELCKVSLWMEALEPGRPLSFLDDRIVFGNSLLGAPPNLLAAGIPGDAFKPILGDDKQIAAALRKRNALELKGQMALDVANASAEADLRAVARRSGEIAAVDDHSLAGVRERQRRYDDLLLSPELQRARLGADLWCTAFVAPKRRGETGITQDALLRALRSGSISDDEFDIVERASEDYAFHHWHLAFPAVWQRGGFDVVVGNPPWERIKLAEKEFFASRAPEIANARTKAQRTRLIEQLQHEYPDVFASFQAAARKAEGDSHFMRSSGCFPLTGRGDVNTYAVFAELMRTLISPTGRAGCIVPTGIATDDTTRHFFADLVDTRGLVSLFDFENRENIFPAVYFRVKFCLLTLAGSAVPVDEAAFVSFAHRVDDLTEPGRRFTLTREDFALLNPNTRTCPVFRSTRDSQIVKNVYQRVPVLIRGDRPDGNTWHLTFLSMFHMSNDSGLFRTGPELRDEGYVLDGNIYVRGTDRMLPLYEAKMVNYFDHRYGDYGLAVLTPGKAVRELPHVPASRLQDPAYCPLPNQWVAEGRIEDKLQGRWSKQWLLGWRDITNATNERTVIAGLIPRVGVANNFPLALCPLPVAHVTCLVANLSSFVLDFVARCKVGGTHLNFFIFEQLPVLPPGRFDADAPWAPEQDLASWIAQRVLELVYTAGDMEPFAENLGYRGRPMIWSVDRREILRAELDAAYFHLYEIGRDEVEYVLDTFWVVNDRDQRAHGEYRTRRLILERYDAMAAATEYHSSYHSPLDPAPGAAWVVTNDRGALASESVGE
jgi:hypothetical protein